MIIPAQKILEYKPLSPIVEKTISYGMSYGLSAAGYDVRVEFDSFGGQDMIRLNRGQFALASTIEHFNMPDFLLGIVHDKSSWARRGLAVQNTVIEPGWSGYLTLELTNHGLDHLIIKRGMPIAQIIFHQLSEPTNRPYTGKYQAQKRGPQEPIDEAG